MFCPLFLSPHLVSLAQRRFRIPSLDLPPLLLVGKEPGVDLPDGGVDVADSGRLNDQFAR